jgi:LexA-binding, inner membrane-associated putative hydrolase
MTTYEHALLGATGAIALGLHRPYGWPIVAMAAVTAVLPDWDGLSILFGADMLDRMHRVIGHNLLVCVLLGATFAAADYRWAMLLRVKQWTGRRIRMFAIEDRLPQQLAFNTRDLLIWVWVGVVASLSHLLADLVYSGHAEYSDWGLKLFWPFSDRAFVHPMVPWGDIGAALILSIGMFAMLARPSRVRTIAGTTLVVVLAYIVGRGIVGI